MDLFKGKRIIAIGDIKQSLPFNVIENVPEFNQIKCTNYDVVIVGYGNQEYIEMCLQRVGLIRSKDYFLIQEVLKYLGKKKLCLMVGTCILLEIERCLLESTLFTEEYEIIYSDIDLVEEYGLDFTYSDNLLENVDLYLYTTDASKYRMNNAALISKLNNSCLQLAVSGCIFSGYFPQSFLGRDKTNPYGFEDYVNKIFICELMDKNINEMLEDGRSKSEIITEISDVNYYSQNFLDVWFKKSFDFLRISEMSTDISIYDYLKDNYLTEKLYHSAEHPRKKIIKYLCVQILRRINCEDTVFLETEVDDDDKGMPLYPSVRKYLHLGESSGGIKIYDRDAQEYRRYSFDEYVQEYYNLYLEKVLC